MSVKFLFSTFVILLITLTFFALDTVADSESASDTTIQVIIKIVMTFRGTNTFNALVLQTCYFLIDEDNQVSLVGSPDNTESSPVTTAQLSASIDAASQTFESVTSLADLLLFFTSEG